MKKLGITTNGDFMKCDIEICDRKASAIYVATVSKRRVRLCEYHLKPLEERGLKIVSIVKRCSK
jgi:hypothetical protein